MIIQINQIMLTSLAVTIIAYLLCVNHFDTVLSAEGAIIVYTVTFFFSLIITQLNQHINGPQSLPTYEEYIAGHPECNLRSGTRCNTCGSNEIEKEAAGACRGDRLTFFCKNCGTQLYREKL